MDYSTYYAEKAAGVYDYDDEGCNTCDRDPCECDYIYDKWRDREFD